MSVKKKRGNCNAGKGCFNCPYPDCVNAADYMTAEEKTMYAASGLSNVRPKGRKKKTASAGLGV